MRYRHKKTRLQGIEITLNKSQTTEHKSKVMFGYLYAHYLMQIRSRKN